ncbi:MAG: acyltransferase family protein [Devosia nanyangense]|uniref:Acyltransferase family protein n=1 Tax=Devosia nanyangense TaxID=1228055 RepID=A0A933L2H6_9HYPH|nr:acyltransferase family protein [Devosia nanyangense]
MVILLHCAARYLYEYNAIALADWRIADIVDSAVRFSVPLFFMVSGYVFYGPHQPRPRHLMRLVMCIVAYGCIAVGYKAIWGSGALDALLLLPFAPPFYHLWFFYTLAPVYLVGMLVTVREPPRFWLIIGLAVIFFVVLNPHLAYLAPFSLARSGAAALDGSVIWYVLYAILGAALGRSVAPRLPWGGIAVIIVVGTTAIIARDAEVRTAAAADGTLTAPLFNYMSVPVLAGAVAIFMAVRTGTIPVMARPTLLFVHRYSLPLYGLHALVLDALWRRLFWPADQAWKIAAIFPLTVLLTLCIAIPLSSIDRRRWIT